ncbi:MAG: hypothetical protein QOD64_696, partial [Verrucomicrobiota bacterium]
AALEYGPACGCGDHASYDTGIHSAAETAERFAATRSSNRDSRRNHGNRAASSPA